MTNLEEHDAALAITKQQIEMAMREMLEQYAGFSSAESRRMGLAAYLHGRFSLDDALVERFLGRAA
jgi:hypothetical protein